MQDVQAEGVMMRGWASMCPCEWASMCPCKWVCVCASGNVSVQVRWEGVKIMKGWASMWGDKTYLCGEMQVGTDAMRVRGNASMWVGQGGIHVRMCRWAWM